MEFFSYSLTIIIASGVFSFAIAFPIISLLYKFKITRRMDVDFSSLTSTERQNLKVGVPIMGGLIVVFSVTILNFLFNPDITNKGILLMLFIFVLSALLGGFDDILNIFGAEREKPKALSRTLTLIKVHKSLKKRLWLLITLPWEMYKRFFFILGSNPGKGIQSHEKILVQTVAGLALGIGLYFYSSRANPGELNIPILGGVIDIGILIIPFALATVLLMTNAVNLADGMDALSSSMLLAAFGGFLLIAIHKEDTRSIFLVSTVIGSLISYLYFNVPPARFQMGDVGSLSLGALLASIAFLLGEPLMLLIIGLPFAVTLLSAVLQGLGRRLLGRRIFRMAPIHYHLQMKYNWTEEKVVMRLALLGLVCSIIGVWIYFIDKF